MRISLTPETTQRIREALGADVDLAPDVVPSVLARLAVEAPAAYSQVLEELSGSQIRLDSEEELRRRRRRSVFRRLLFSWGEYESAAGERLLDKRHIAAAVPLALAVLTMGVLAFSLVLGHRALPASGQHEALKPAPRQTLRPETRVPSLFVPRPDPIMRDLITGTTQSLPSPAFGRSTLEAMLPGPPPSSFAGPPATARSLGNPVVVSLPGGATGGERLSALSPVVYNRSTDMDSAQREGGENPNDPAISKTAGSAPGSRPAGGLAQPLMPGMRLPATLLTGAVVVPGGPAVPVVVQTTDPQGFWMGQATLGPGDRVQLTVTLTTQNRTEEARGIALDPEHLLPGLPGRTTVRHSSAAAAMATAGLQAVSDYAQAAARQGSISVLNGVGPVVVAGQVPDAWTYLAARLAQQFQARGDTGGWVTTTEVPPGTQLIILLMGAS